jgi:putative sigma-54 modulation protein
MTGSLRGRLPMRRTMRQAIRRRLGDRFVQIQISTRHGHLSDASQAKISSRAEKLTRIFDRLTAIEVIIDLTDSNLPRVDGKVSAEHKHDFVAHDQSDNLMASVDTVIHRLEQQIRKYKEKVQERHRNSEPRHRQAPAEMERERE